MPTLPMYQTTQATADAWHQVTSPGGYEWWYFDAEDPASGLQIVATFFQGFVFHPQYLRRYFRYRAHPTRHAPPVPAEYPCAHMVIYEHGKILSQFMTQYRPEEFTASVAQPEVKVGPNQFRLNPGTGYQLHLEGSPWHLTWRGPKRPAGGKLSANLTFSPTHPHPPYEGTFLSRDLTGADHHCVIAAPACGVNGTIRIERAGEPPRDITFTGRGYHDHHYGTGPLGPGLGRWVWGRILWDDRVTTFHLACPRDRSLADESHVVEASVTGVIEQPAAVHATWQNRTAPGLLYPEELRLGLGLRLSHPKIVDATPFYLRLTYDAVDHTEHPSHTATAFCEVVYPHRLRWPLLGRMIEMSIHKP